jgi:phosphoribosylformylglycinamidine cyclo-ligase
MGALLETTFSYRAGKVGTPLMPIGHYAGLIDIGHGKALTMHTDGVGTKVLVAQEVGIFDTVGIDCVAMTVNDLICLGSEPVALLDYIALERENEGLVAELGKGLVEGARRASVAIVGGETAILGDLVKGNAGRGFDLASMGVGIVKPDEVIDGSSIEEGDVVIGVASSGLHSNGYTLARKALRRHSLDERMDEVGSTLGETLLTPTSIYVKPSLEAIRRCEVHGFAHITGGSFSKLTRLVGGRGLGFDLTLPPPPEIFNLIRHEGNISEREMYRAFNMGVGLCTCLPESEAGRCSRVFKAHGFPSYYIGSVKRGAGIRVNGLGLS